GALLLATGHLLQFANVLGRGGEHVVAWMVPLLFVQGCGLGMVMAPLVSAVLAGLQPQHAGVASGVLATVQQAGNSLGVALIGVVFYGRLGGTADTAVYSAAFADSLLALAVSALLVAALYRRVRRATGC
ncbi:MAG: MFS transporter, partial [Ramlibacter sp.]